MRTSVITQNRSEAATFYGRDGQQLAWDSAANAGFEATEFSVQTNEGEHTVVIWNADGSHGGWLRRLPRSITRQRD